MYLNNKKFFKYSFVILFVVWVLLTFDIGYRYIQTYANQKPVEGGTFVEGTFDNVNYMPYTSFDSDDIFYQSFIFDGCMEAYASGTNIEYRENLCNVETQDYQNFTVSIKENKYWSDGQKVNIDDLAFTYSGIIVENVWDMSYFEGFDNLEVTSNEDSISIEFPDESIDNQSFLTNAILPKHILENKTLEYYLMDFSQDPVGSDCGRLGTTRDSNSLVFDVSVCEDLYINNYQVKRLYEPQDLYDYSDMLHYYDIDKQIDGFESNKFIKNQITSLFFNIESGLFNYDMRKAFVGQVLNRIYEENPYFIRDKFLFGDTDYESESFGSLLANKEAQLTEQTEREIDVPDLPEEAIEFNQDYYVGNEIVNARALNFQVGTGYDSVAVSHNDGTPYFLESYQPGSQTAKYNISPGFNNVIQGENTYKVDMYQGDSLVDSQTLTVYYLNRPTETVQPEVDELVVELVYRDNEVHSYIINRIQNILEEKELIDYFEFNGLDSKQEYDEILKSGEYDMALHSVDLGLQNHSMSLFAIDNPIYNPSMYTNSTLANLIKDFYIMEGDDRQSLIDDIRDEFSRTIPFARIGKFYDKVYIKQDLNFSLPLRLYDVRFRRDYLSDIKMVTVPSLNTKQDWDEILDFDKFRSFIKENLEK